MIEIIYNESGKKESAVTIKPPKNIRQIGSPRGRHKIYMEDYVYTFLHSAVFEGDSQKRAAVLLGQSEVSQDIRYTFISGAISCEDFVFQKENIVFDESCWEYIYKEIKQYFDCQEVVGWFLGMPGFPLELTLPMESAHRKYFTGREKVLFLSEPSEGEDAFYAYEQGILQKKEGYYVYYEKNLPMQEYMVCMREKAREKGAGIEERIGIQFEDYPRNASVEEILKKEEKKQEKIEPQQDEPNKELEKEEFNRIEELETKSEVDQALNNYRTMMLDKKETGGQKKISVFLYTAAATAMVVLCVIGITTLNNYEKMKEVEATLSLLSQSTDKTEDTKNTQETDKANKAEETEQAGLIVESIPGEVEPEQEDSKSQSENTNTDNKDNNKEEKEAPETEQESAKEPDSKDEEAENTSQEAQEEQPEAAKETENTTKDTVQTSAQTYLEQGYYVVQAGDKLETICKKIYQTTAMVEKLREVNGIEDVDKIYVGQKLVLP